MVTPRKWRDAYRDQRDAAEELKSAVDLHLSKTPHSWFVDSRIKEPESFFQKVETGRFDDIEHLEDFFAAMVVVPLQSEINEALIYVGTFFEIAYRRPRNDTEAVHVASDFRFNDIRLYGTLRKDESLPPSPIDDIVFELQVKTFFQHAWSSATHDLVYKYPRFSWPRSRVAAQVKAMVESAELTMDSIDSLESSRVLPAEGSPESGLNAILDILLEEWTEGDLPSNLKRTTETIADLCSAFSIEADDLRARLSRGRAELSGHPEGWSPYQCLVDYTSRYDPTLLKRVLKKKSRRPKVIYVTEDVLARLKLTIDDCVCASLS